MTTFMLVVILWSYTVRLGDPGTYIVSSIATLTVAIDILAEWRADRKAALEEGATDE